MSDRRKLQGEIDRCLKKVTEGVETFEDIWQKINDLQVHGAPNSNQKEKYEADLKKEIKKLQRLRDQIKTWVASSEIKDKRQLLDNRKLIEVQMERFKVVERETKTKAYSKEGLGAAAKIDPREKEKEEMTIWIATMLEKLNMQIDHTESEAESLSVKKKKVKQERIEELKTRLERHRFHINQLETIMRMMDNDALDPELIKKIKDDVEYYVECNQDPDFQEDELLYEDLDLEELSAALGSNLVATSPPEEDHFANISGTPTSTNSSSPSPSPNIPNHSKKSDEDSRKRHKGSEEVVKVNSQKSSSSTSSSSTSSSGSCTKVPQTPTKHNHQNSATSGAMPMEGSVLHPLSTPPPNQGYAQAAGAHHNSTSGPSPQTRPSTQHSVYPHLTLSNRTVSANLTWNDKTVTNSVDHLGASSCLVNNTSATVTSESSSPSGLSPAIPPAPTQAPHSNSSGIIAQLPSVPVSSSTLTVADSYKVIMNGPTSVGTSLLKVSSSSNSSSMTLKSMAQQAVQDAGLESWPTSIPDSLSLLPSQKDSLARAFESVSQGLTPSVVSSMEQSQVNLVQQQPPSLQSQSLSTQQPQSAQTTTIHLNPLLGVAPLGPQLLSKEHCYQLAMGEAVYHHLPHPSDSERLRHYLPRSPCPTPAYYPQVPPPHADTVEFFQRLSVETLFFIFYYMEGTKAQYLAAKALKKQSWRFHTKYMMWFQRHEEPKTITEDYEQGTYIYFDYEKWGQRKKEGFTFEYRYLEDRDLN